MSYGRIQVQPRRDGVTENPQGVRGDRPQVHLVVGRRGRRIWEDLGAREQGAE